LDQNRRSFLTKGVANLLIEGCRSLAEGLDINNAPDDEAANLSYFSSFESCYAFLAEASLEELQEDARQLGLDPTGKDKYQIAKSIFRINQAKSHARTEG